MYTKYSTFFKFKIITLELQNSINTSTIPRITEVFQNLLRTHSKTLSVSSPLYSPLRYTLR